MSIFLGRKNQQYKVNVIIYYSFIVISFLSFRSIESNGIIQSSIQLVTALETLNNELLPSSQNLIAEIEDSLIHQYSGYGPSGIKPQEAQGKTREQLEAEIKARYSFMTELQEAIFQGNSKQLQQLLHHTNPNTQYDHAPLLAWIAGLAVISPATLKSIGLNPIAQNTAQEMIGLLVHSGASTEHIYNQVNSLFNSLNNYYFRAAVYPTPIENAPEPVRQEMNAVYNFLVETISNKTPLHSAAGSNNKEEVERLIVQKVTIDARDNKQNTPLHEAAYYGNSEIIRLLVNAGADINAQDSNGDTPLHKALYDWNNKIDAARTLIGLGASKDLKNKNGLTPLDLAKPETKMLLQQ